MSDNNKSDNIGDGATRLPFGPVENGLQRHVEFIPGFYKIHPDPSKNYGISGGRMIFVVTGPLGAVHFVFGAGLYPPRAVEHLVDHHKNRSGHDLARSLAPMGYDVGYHALVEQYEGQSPHGECEWLGGRVCYSDGSGVRSDKWMSNFIESGTKWLWPALEQEYRDRFGDTSGPTGSGVAASPPNPNLAAGEKP